MPLAVVRETEGPTTVTVQLSVREQQIIHCIVDGLADKEIAAKLGITKRTVKFHLIGLRLKLNLVGMGRSSLVTWAFRNGLVK